MASILNHTTKIDHHKTIGEITKVLVSHGAKKIMIDYDDEQLPASLTFCVLFNNSEVVFRLPARYNGVLNAMEKAKSPKNLLNKQQAVRVAWRIIKDWVEAQMAIVQAELAEIPEIFLPYAVNKHGNTLYEGIKENMGNPKPNWKELLDI